MKNLKFGVFCLALAVAVAAAVSGLAAQDRFEFRTPEGQTRGNLMMLDGRGSQLGVQVSDVDPSTSLGAGANGGAGVKVDEVNDDSPADKAGLKAGDVVVEFDGERVRSARQFTRLVQETPEGRTVKIAVLRNGQRQVLDATPEARSFTWNMNIDGDRIRRDIERGLRDGLRDLPRRFEFRMDPGGVMRLPSRGRLGVTVDSLSPQLAEFFGVKEGALVSSVTQGSAAEKAGIKAGDVITSVNGDAVRDADDLIRELGDAGGTEVAIGIVRDKKASTVKAVIDKPKGLSPPMSPRSRPGVRL